MLLAIETSCDETALALCRGEELVPVAQRLASQVALHEAYGGVVPELAAREHIRALPHLFNALLKDAGCTSEDICAVAVTAGPGLQGCLLVGVSFAKAFAQARRIPLYACHHIEGHIAAVHLNPEAREIQYPALALIVSGGHTMLVRIQAERRYSLLTETRDDAAGEAFDKIASLLKLPYPGGPSLSKLAVKGNTAAFDFPRALPRDLQSYSFSGLKTAVSRVVQSLDEAALETARADLAASAQEAIVTALVDKVRLHLQREEFHTLIVSGGVAANARLREVVSELSDEQQVNLAIPPIQYCTDNAAMIAVLGQQLRQLRQDWDPGSELGPGVGFSLGARSRWPFLKADNAES